jgi:hypothetical protein
MESYKLLCTPCAAELRRGGELLEVIGGKSAKITCENCQRRRFGVKYIFRGAKSAPKPKEEPKLEEKRLDKVCGKCKFFRKNEGKKSGGCALRTFARDRDGNVDESREFVVFLRSRGCAKFLEAQ